MAAVNYADRTTVPNVKQIMSEFKQVQQPQKSNAFTKVEPTYVQKKPEVSTDNTEAKKFQSRLETKGYSVPNGDKEEIGLVIPSFMKKDR